MTVGLDTITQGTNTDLRGVNTALSNALRGIHAIIKCLQGYTCHYRMPSGVYMNIIKCLRHLELSAGTMPTMGLPPVSASENRQGGGVVVGVGWQGDGGWGGG